MKKLLIIFASYYCALSHSLVLDRNRKESLWIMRFPQVSNPRLTAGDPAAWRPVDLQVTVPTGSVTLADNSLFKPVLERNVNFLLNYINRTH